MPLPEEHKKRVIEHMIGFPNPESDSYLEQNFYIIPGATIDVTSGPSHVRGRYVVNMYLSLPFLTEQGFVPNGGYGIDLNGRTIQLLSFSLPTRVLIL